MVLTTIVASAMTRVVAAASPLPRIAVGMPVGIEGVVHVRVVAKTLIHRDRSVWPTVFL